ncbi:MAG: hypothetical protein Q8O74_04825 [bacterium]|nr:hypothetical protein [bacterium]
MFYNKKTGPAGFLKSLLVEIFYLRNLLNSSAKAHYNVCGW